MSETVTVASRLPVAVLMQTDTGLPGIEACQVIVSSADPGAINGHGITHGVDPAAFEQWITAHPQFAEVIFVTTEDEIEHHSDPANTYGFELGLMPVEAPVNVDVPYAAQSGATATCTMGNWQGEPTSYGYLWMRDGAPEPGASNPTLPLTADHVGHTLTCVVTATNAAGSTAAPPSNGVLIQPPSRA